MDCVATNSATRDYGLREGIPSIFSDFKTCGFGLEDTRRRSADGVCYLLLIRTLAIYGCEETGCCDVHEWPTPLGQKTAKPSDPVHWSLGKVGRPRLSWFQRGQRRRLHWTELGRPMPCFGPRHGLSFAPLRIKMLHRRIRAPSITSTHRVL